MNGYQAALAYVRRGWAVVPLDGKRPIPLGWQSGRVRTEADVEEWWGQHPQRNVGLVTGHAGGGFWVLDIDARSGGYESLAALEAEHGALPRTLQARTGGGGVHFFWRLPDADVPCATGLRPGIDVKGNGGQVVVWPSVHPDTGKRYEWAGRVDDLAEAPGWLLDLVFARERQKAEQRKVYEALPVQAVDDSRMARWAARALDGACSDVAQAGEGTRHDVLLRKARMVGGYVAAGALSEGEAAARLADAGLAAGLGQREVSTVVRDGMAHGMRDPMPVPLRLLEEVTAPSWGDSYLDALAEAEEPPARVAVVAPARARRPTDVGNAERLVERFGQDVRWCGSMPGDGMLVWDGLRWATDTRRKVDGLARAVAAELHEEATRLGERADDVAREAGAKPTQAQKEQVDAARAEARTWLQWARQSEMAPRLEAMVRVARSEVAVSYEELDADPWALNTRSGIVDLRTGEESRHDRERLCTRLAGGAVGGECPTWLAFLRRIMGGDDEMVRFVQRVVGYCLTGSTREQALFILYGNGSNGKSTFLDTVRKVLGDYAVHTRADTFMRDHRTGGGVPNDVAALRGARLVTASEPEQGAVLNESQIKEMTGDSALTARFMRAEFFTFEPTFKVLLATNHRPIVRGTDHGIWRRIRLVPFTETIADDEKDPELGKKLAAEHDGILRWALAGCIEWQRVGLAPPERVLLATTEYRTDMDLVGEYLSERCVLSPDATVANTELWQDFDRWSRERGEKERSQQWLTRALFDRGLRQNPSRKQGRRWDGIALRHSFVVVPGGAWAGRRADEGDG